MADFLLMKLRLIGSLFPLLLDALGVTVGIAALALPLAVALGLLLAVLRWMGPGWLTAVLRGWIEFLRNTPLLLQMFMVYFGVAQLGWRLDGFYCGVFAIAIQHSAFLAETFRGALESITRRQWEATRALGIRDRTALWHLILPQAAIKVAAPIGNQLIVLVKDTSLVSGIAVLDLTLTGKIIMERNAASFEVFIVVAMYYLGLTVVLGALVRMLEIRTRTRVA
ncbi:MAG TPA: amino acid ABC transporter permease [Caldimonas sp.]|jgi:His/Glu/Gln/Arg/opine family amino acid ABC transporter permease subunit|nr:amino acid ABC transporter permease [Caldimonas sp.]